MKKIILASASPRRRELLGSLGLDFDICVSGVEEVAIEGENPAEHALRLAREKALAAEAPNGSFVIGADTIVIIDGEVLGKPQDRVHAGEMLRKLSGCTHRVITAFAIVRDGEVLASRTVESAVLFKDISEKELAWYIRDAGTLR